MPKKSTIKNRNTYLDSREALNLTREKAAELTGISESRMEKIESGKTVPYPEDILSMAVAYRNPALTNYYCSKECPIGRKYVPETENKSLSEIVLSMLALLQSLNSNKERLIEISADGRIDDTELQDFVRIRKELDQISANTDSLRLWIDQMILSGSIDADKLEQYSSDTLPPKKD